MPSPAIATTRPSRLQPLDDLGLLRRAAPRPSTSSMPSCARDRLGRRAAVAGEHDDRAAPRRAARAIASGVVGLDRDRRRRRARPAAPSTATNIDRLPLARAAPRPASRSAAGVDAELVEQRGVAERDVAAVDRAAHALAGDATRKSSTAGERDARARARRRRSPRPADARCRARALAARRSSVGFVDAADAARPSTSVGLPSVSVPVLSTTSVSTCSQHLERLGVAGPARRPRRRARCRP